MTEPKAPQSEIVLYQTQDGRTRIQCRFEDKTVWLTQKIMGELFQKDVRTINEHIQNVLAEGELSADSVIRKFRITAADGKAYQTQHYSLEMVLAVGYRVKSPRGTQFRQWATARLTEYLVKGFTMDDERLKNPPGPGVLERSFIPRLLTPGCCLLTTGSSLLSPIYVLTVFHFSFFTFVLQSFCTCC